MFIGAEKGLIDLDDVIDDHDDVTIAAITVTELLVGVELADEHRRTVRDALVEDIVAGFPIEAYDVGVARVHAALITETKRRGRPRGFYDLIIAATAAAHSRTVLTTDTSGFDDLPGVSVRVSPRSTA